MGIGKCDRLLSVRESFNNVTQSIGEILLPIISKVLTQLVPVINSIILWTQQHPKLTEAIVLTATALGSLLVVLAPVLLLISAISTPILIAVAALVAMGAIIFELVTHWREVSIAIQPFIDQVKELAKSALELLKPAIDILIVSVKALWQNFQLIWELLAPILIPLFKALAIFLAGVFVGSILTAIAAITLIALSFNVLIEIVKTVAGWLANLIFFFTDTLPNAVKTFEKSWVDSWNNIKKVITDVVDIIQSKIDGVVSAWNKAQALVSAPIGALGTAIKNAPANISQTFKGGKAGGGSVTAGNTYLVGEMGAELFSPTQNGFITPNNAFGGGGGNITVNINGGTYLSEGVALQIGNMIVNRLKMVSKIRV